MACEYCTDTDGMPCFPVYGLAPHLHGTGPGHSIGAHFKPHAFWPDNFQEDPDCPNHGVWWCPECGDGMPEDIKASSCMASGKASYKPSEKGPV